MESEQGSHQRIDELEKEREQLKKSLRQSEDRFRTFFRTASNPMTITTIKDGRMIDVNEACARLSGYKREELIGTLATERSLWADTKQRNRLIQMLQGEGRIHSLEATLRSRAGALHKILFSADPLDVNGEPCLLAVLVDITAREKEADILKKSEEKYRMLVENSLQGLAIIQGDQIKFCNNAYAKIMGYSVEELLSFPNSKTLIHPEDRELVRSRHHDRLMGKPVPPNYEHRIITKNGETRCVEIYATLVEYEGEPALQVVCIDITDYKRLQAQFLQSQKMEAIGVLAGGVAHDFNNLLNVINGYSELILKAIDPDNPIRKDLEHVREAGQHAASLTSQLLAFSRKQILQPEILDLNEIITQMGAMLRRMIGEDIEIVTAMQPGLGLINADPGQIQQILMNLAVNARDAMPQGGKLTIETADADCDENYVKEHPAVKVGPYVMLAIADNGVGMDDETKAHISEPFFTTKGKDKGTGLGLSTIYGIVKQSNGFVWVYSEPGKGTAFKIYFPRVEGGTAKVDAKRKSETESTGFETVLVVEDEASVRALACRILKDRGYAVLDAPDGKQALRIAEEYPGEIHLVLTDVVMPGISSKDLVFGLKSKRPNLKILYASGYTGNAIVHHGILDPDVAFLQKPFTVKSLAHKVCEVIDS